MARASWAVGLSLWCGVDRARYGLRCTGKRDGFGLAWPIMALVDYILAPVDWVRRRWLAVVERRVAVVLIWMTTRENGAVVRQVGLAGA